MDPEKLTKISENEIFAEFFQRHGRTILGLFVLALMVHDVFGTHGFIAMRHTRIEIEKVRKDIGRLNDENQKLSDEVKSLKTDPHYIEGLGREMGLIKKGEIVIRIPQSQQPDSVSPAKP
jgi:cell division protein FtsB